ncbi:helix-turn-helix transcriptional regulator [Brachybacterium paraconglomeratum]|uniref:helix-turn-helix transcriptional regulator n=1 Tax=Brachybacterium paraconglomeratum TaxID=173362 RepID=UPI0035171259
MRIADVAAAVHLTPSHAMTVFRRTVGVILGQYVTMCRVAEAQRLLLTTSLRVTEIAEAAGFGSLSSFYEHVSEACGMTPREYRRQGR